VNLLPKFTLGSMMEVVGKQVKTLCGKEHGKETHKKVGDN